VGESDTIHRGGGEFWSYLHASFERGGVSDSCGDPAPFPGCVTLWKSTDGGQHFALENPVCLFPCQTCPCSPQDHTQQQQYPRVFWDSDRVYIVYEWGAGTHMRTSTDGVHWSAETNVPGTGQWHGTCTEAESVGEHPNIYAETEFGNCLVGAPPGLWIEGDLLYVFVGLGRDPGHMGCYVGNKYTGAAGLRKCASNPLFGAELGYGPPEALEAAANPYFEFRTISSADVVRVGDHYYMVYEGVRGPSDPTVVDNQFALGLARSIGLVIDGPWEKYPDNPIIMDLANNWGIGHGDLVIVGTATYLYTATSQTTRGRYVLVRK
jgi:beta-xylosidase